MCLAGLLAQRTLLGWRSRNQKQMRQLLLHGPLQLHLLSAMAQLVGLTPRSRIPRGGSSST